MPAPDVAATPAEPHGPDDLRSLLDPGSALDLGHGAAHGTLDGRPVTVVDLRHGPAGAPARAVTDRALRAVDLATSTGCPVVVVHGSADPAPHAPQAPGAPGVPDPVDLLADLDRFGQLLRALARASGVVPHVAVVTGPCHGAAAHAVALADAVVTVATARPHPADAAARALADPAAGPDDLRATGPLDLAVDSPAEALDHVAAVLDHLPPNNLTAPPLRGPVAPARPHGPDPLPSHLHAPHDPSQLFEALLDDGLLVGGQGHGQAVTGLARLAGHPVGVVLAGAPALGGLLDAATLRRVTRLVRLCDAFDLPVVTFVDAAGPLPGPDPHGGGQADAGAALAHAYAVATVPLVTVVLRAAIGTGHVLLGARALGADLVLAWPDAHLAALGPHATAQLHLAHAHRAGPHLTDHDGPDHDGDDHDDDDHDDDRRARLVAEARRHAAPAAVAHLGVVDAVVEPAATRGHLVAALAAVRTKRAVLPPRKHATVPW